MINRDRLGKPLISLHSLLPEGHCLRVFNTGYCHCSVKFTKQGRHYLRAASCVRTSALKETVLSFGGRAGADGRTLC